MTTKVPTKIDIFVMKGQEASRTEAEFMGYKWRFEHEADAAFAQKDYFPEVPTRRFRVSISSALR